MIILDSSTKLQAILAGAVATNQSDIVVSWSDLTTTTNGNTAVDIVAAPAASTERLIKSIFITNVDTAVITVTIRTNISAATKTILTATLNVGDNLEYVDGAGWAVLDNTGALRNNALSTGRLIRAPQTLTSGATYTIPTGCNAIEFELIGGGGGGGGVSNSAANAAAGGGGAAGGYLRKYIANPPGTTITYAIGAGGTAGSNAGGNGGNGGATSITINGTTYTTNPTTSVAIGMTFGTAAAIVNGGVGTVPINGDINIQGNPGYPGIRQSGTIACSGNGGASVLGGGAIGSNADNTVGVTGAVYGGGGSGANTLGGGAQTGGVGGAGAIIIREYY